MNRIFWVFLLFCSTLFAERGELWVTARFPIGEVCNLNFHFWQQHRFDLHTAKLVDNRYSLWARKGLLNWLDGEVHYTLINSRNVNQTLYRQSGRMELELNPRFTIGNKLELRLRNRYELLHRDGDPRLGQVFRQRHQINYNLDLKYLKSVSIHNEVFFNLTENEFDQYRFVPIELGFPLFKTHTLRVGTMIRWLKRDDEWGSQFVLGLMIDW